MRWRVATRNGRQIHMPPSSVLFCPFCAEPFEGLARCPTHDLELVPFRELARIRAVDDEARVPVFSFGMGRGALFLGAALTLVAFLCPLVRLSGQVELTNTIEELATGRAPRLWLVPAAALATISILVRRRTPVGMRGARLALCLLALLPAVVVAITVFGAHEATAQLAGRLGAQVHVHWGAGAWLVWIAVVPLLWGSLRFGVRPLPRVR